MSWMAKRRMMVQIMPRDIFRLPSTISERRETGKTTERYILFQFEHLYSHSISLSLSLRGVASITFKSTDVLNTDYVHLRTIRRGNGKLHSQFPVGYTALPCTPIQELQPATFSRYSRRSKRWGMQ